MSYFSFKSSFGIVPIDLLTNDSFVLKLSIINKKLVCSYISRPSSEVVIHKKKSETDPRRITKKHNFQSQGLS